ncbi:MAG: 5'-nucleotidase C-terminal domain-containing protein [Halanaerobiales bacterium]|nr:5'-nucleotidase C-terminal domain-containing protein [Halanaerobiales bacterium]
MTRLKKKLFVLMLVLTMLVVIVLPSLATEEQIITILGTSDLHGRIYPYYYATDSNDSDAGLAKIQTLIKAERALNPEAILVDAGDLLQDNLADLFNDDPVHPMIQVFNYIKYDTWTLGNHEFNYGLDFLNKNIAAFNGNVLAANIYKEDGTRYVKPYAIFNRNGVRVAIVGLITPHIPKWEASNPDHFKGLTFVDPVEEAKKVVKELEGKYDVLVGVFHMSDTSEYTKTDGANAVATACPEFSVIYTGHKHAKFDDKEVNGVKIIEPGQFGAALGKAEIKLSKSGDVWTIESVTTTNLETKPVDADQELLNKFASVHKASLAEANKVVGEVTADFIDRVDYITGEDKVTTIPTSQIQDTAVIDIINTVQMFYADADIASAALFNIGSNLKKGPFKKKDAAYIYKYDNTLIGVKITGKNLKAYMEWSMNYYNTYKPGDITVSFNPKVRAYNYDMFAGVTYDVDISKDAGNRVTNLKFNEKSVQDDQVYKLAINNYRFGTLLKEGFVKDEDKYFDSYEKYQDDGRVRDLIIRYLQEEKNGILNPEIDNNWKIIGADLESPYKEIIFTMVRKGEITIPFTEDGRTPNIVALNVIELKAEGKLGQTYTVKINDYLWKIAEKFQTTWQTLAKFNNLINPDLIFPDQIILIPVQ